MTWKVIDYNFIYDVDKPNVKVGIIDISSDIQQGIIQGINLGFWDIYFKQKIIAQTVYDELVRIDEENPFLLEDLSTQDVVISKFIQEKNLIKRQSIFKLCRWTLTDLGKEIISS